MNSQWKLFLTFILIHLLLMAVIAWDGQAIAAQITLTWVDNSNNEDGFIVERQIGRSGPFAPIAMVGVNVISYTDSSLASAIIYCYRVRAFNAAANSPYSNKDCVPIPKLDADTDGDGLSDNNELNLFGTDPVLSDTDGDGISDGVEISQGSNALDPLSYLSNSSPIIVDNMDGTSNGMWSTSTSRFGYWEGNYQYQSKGSGTNTFVWTPNLPQSSLYDVYARWTSSFNRATNAQYEIFHDDGSELVEVDQTQGGGQWVYLGTYFFATGSSGFVQLSDYADGYVIADAVKWESSALVR